LFFDADLPACAGQVARSFPDDLARIAERAPPAPWMYTGGLENYPRLVARISRQRELLGARPESLPAVRDPFEVERVLRGAGFLFPDCRRSSEGLPRDGTWLRKGLASSGGLRVSPWRGPSRRAGQRGWYFQRRVDGLPMSAVYLVAAGRSCLLGATRQILTAAGGLPFQYAGSIGPLELTPQERSTVSALGDLLAGRFELRGLFGVDLVQAGQEIWTIEINPRYTASVEVLERTLGFNAISLHIAACREARLPHAATTQPSAHAPGSLCGKAIVYGCCDRVADEEMVKTLCERNRDHAWPRVADIPRAGTPLRPGHPVLTVFAEAQSEALVRAQLRTAADELRKEFGF
jgi:predicted ATP-grasp superfamily ATP-dependent carboligase